MAEAAIKNDIVGKAVEIAGVDKATEAPKHSAGTEIAKALAKQEAGHAALEAARSGRRMGISDEKLNDTVGLLRVADQGDGMDRLSKVDHLMSDGYDSLPTGEKDDFRKEILTTLDGSWTNSLTTSMNPAERNKAAEDLCKDDELRDLINSRLHDITTRVFNPSEAEIAAQINYLKTVGGDNRASTDPDLILAATEGLKAGSPALENFRAELATDIDNLIPDSVNTLLTRNLDSAHDTVVQRGTELDAEVARRQAESGQAATAKIKGELDKKWAKTNPDAFGENGAIAKSWKDFLDKGIDGVLTSAQQGALAAYPELRAQYEQEIGMDLLLRRMQVGKLGVGDLDRLVHAEWMGATPDDRLNKIRGMMDTCDEIKNVQAEMQERGYLPKDLWDRIKKAGPAAAGGMIAALLASLFIPAASGPILIRAGIAGAGALAGGLGAMKMREAA